MYYKAGKYYYKVGQLFCITKEVASDKVWQLLQSQAVFITD